MPARRWADRPLHSRDTGGIFWHAEWPELATDPKHCIIHYTKYINTICLPISLGTHVIEDYDVKIPKES